MSARAFTFKCFGGFDGFSPSCLMESAGSYAVGLAGITRSHSDMDIARGNSVLFWGSRAVFWVAQVAPGHLHRDDLSEQAWHWYCVVPAIALAVTEHGTQDMDIARGNLALSWGSRAVPWIAGGARAFAQG